MRALRRQIGICNQCSLISFSVSLKDSWITGYPKSKHFDQIARIHMQADMMSLLGIYVQKYV